MKTTMAFKKFCVSFIGVVFSFFFVNAQEARYMVVQLSGNILDCPHFGQKLSNEAAHIFNIQLLDKNDKEAKIIFDVKNHNLDSLRISYQAYLKKIEFPMSYFKEIYFTQNISGNKQ